MMHVRSTPIVGSSQSPAFSAVARVTPARSRATRRSALKTSAINSASAKVRLSAVSNPGVSGMRAARLLANAPTSGLSGVRARNAACCPARSSGRRSYDWHPPAIKTINPARDAKPTRETASRSWAHAFAWKNDRCMENSER
jgi:hypothetical protein